MNDKILTQMVQSFIMDNGKNAVVSIEAETQFSSSPFKGPEKSIEK
jgi:hypothetical protein